MGLFKKKIKKHEQINMTFSDININDDYHEPKIETKEEPVVASTGDFDLEEGT